MTLLLPCLPLIERELRVALRKKRPVRRRWITAALCVAGTVFFLALNRLAPPAASRAELGWRLHQMFCLVGLYILFQAPPLVAGAFAEERRDQTLGLLFLSGLSAAEVFVGKLLSAALIAWTNLLAIFPMLALPFLIGGVSWDLFIATVLTLPSLLVFVLAVTLLASVLTKEEGATVIASVAIGVILCGLPIAIYLAQAQLAPSPPNQGWLRLSPAYAPWLIWNGRAPRREIGSCLGLMTAWSGLCLAAAAAILRGLWRDQAWGGRRAPGAAWLQGLVHGSPSRRRVLAARWLDSNPFVWVATRDGQSTFLAWAVLGGLGLAWLWGWAIWGTQWTRVSNLMLTVTLLNATLRWIIFYTAAKTLADPRRDGSFELLLTTRLEPSDIVWGALNALNVQFRRVGGWVLGLDAVLLLGGLAVRPWTPSALFVYGVAAGALLLWAWPAAYGWRQSPQAIPGVVQALPLAPGWRRALTTMWAGLNSGRPAFSVWRASGVSPWVWVLNLFNLYMFGHTFRGFATFPTGSPLQVKCAAGVAGFIVFGWLIQSWTAKVDLMGGRIIRQFREIVREPLPDRDDPAFRQWNVWDRLPRGRKLPWYHPLRRIG